MTHFFRIFYTIITISFFSLDIHATHIVGGDFKITMVSNGASSSTYDIQLRLYRDNVNGAVNLPSSVTIGIYKVGTNASQTTKTLYLNNGAGSIVPLGDPCYTPNPSIVQIEEGVYSTISTVSLPNYAQGYYLQYETCCRNSLVDNLATPTSDGISIFAMIPNPGLGQNSSPDFGNYPLDAYFCVNNIKNFTWPVTDPDGDQLVYSLVAPMDEGPGFGTGNSSPGSGAYPFYPSCNFGAGYSLSNIIGGTPQMSIDANTGEITASPSIQGFFAFAVRVEEYRNGVKIGEVRRDAQYASLPCIISNPPIFSVNNGVSNPSANTIDVSTYVNDSICLDLEVGVSDPNDSIYLNITSNDFDLLGTYVQPNTLNNTTNPSCNYSFNMYDSYGDGWNGASVDILVNGANYLTSVAGSNMGNVGGPCGSSTITVSNGDIISLSNWVQGTPFGLYDYEISWDITDPNGTVVLSGLHGDTPSISSTCSASNTSLAYYEWQGVNTDTVFFGQFILNSAGYLGSKGSIYMRYCWEAPCEGIDSTYVIALDAYSVDCSGFNQVQSDLNVHVLSQPQSTSIDVPTQITISLDDTMCIDLFAMDTMNPYDTLYLETFSANFDIQGTFELPLLDNSTGQYYYTDFQDTLGKTVYMENYYHLDSLTSALQQVALRYCWVTDCDYVFQEEFDIDYMAFSTVCGSDTVFATSHVEVEPPLGQVEPIPNVFTPNHDGDNDYYQLAGQNDPCYDVMEVSIYNRWGQLVFASSDPNFEWDGTNEKGKDCDNGAYLVIMNGTFGSTYDTNGVRQPNPVKDEFWVHLMR